MQVGSLWYNDDCTLKYSCMKPGDLQRESIMCPESAECKAGEDGNKMCACKDSPSETCDSKFRDPARMFIREGTLLRTHAVNRFTHMHFFVCQEYNI